MRRKDFGDAPDLRAFRVGANGHCCIGGKGPFKKFPRRSDCTQAEDSIAQLSLEVRTRQLASWQQKYSLCRQCVHRLVLRRSQLTKRTGGHSRTSFYCLRRTTMALPPSPSRVTTRQARKPTHLLRLREVECRSTARRRASLSRLSADSV